MKQEEAERLGRKAMELGWRFRRGTMSDVGRFRRMILHDGLCQMDDGKEAYPSWPDFRDELTAFACIPWARSVWDQKMDVEFCDEGCIITAWRGSDMFEFHGDNLPDACIAAVIAAKKAA